MLPFGVTNPATAPQRAEIPEGCILNTVYVGTKIKGVKNKERTYKGNNGG
jgi:hypothetical protein